MAITECDISLRIHLAGASSLAKKDEFARYKVRVLGESEILIEPVCDWVPEEQCVTIVDNFLTSLEDVLKKLLPLNKDSYISLNLAVNSDNGQGSTLLPPELLKRLGDFCIGLTLDVYAPVR